MREYYRVILDAHARADLERRRRYDRNYICDAILAHLSRQPEAESRSRIKRLRGAPAPRYRLRVGDFRVFYTVHGRTVCGHRVLHKSETRRFYKREAKGRL